jgi:hypothetical protein
MELLETNVTTVYLDVWDGLEVFTAEFRTDQVDGLPLSPSCRHKPNQDWYALAVTRSGCRLEPNYFVGPTG